VKKCVKRKGSFCRQFFGLDSSEAEEEIGASQSPKRSLCSKNAKEAKHKGKGVNSSTLNDSIVIVIQ